MTGNDIESEAKDKVATVLPDILDVTLQEYKAYIERPAAEEKALSYSKKQAGAKAGAGHLMLLMKLSALLKSAGMQAQNQESIEDILLIAHKEFKSHQDGTGADDEDAADDFGDGEDQ